MYELIEIPCNYIKLTKSLKAAALLRYIEVYTFFSKDPDKWFTRTYPEMENDLALTAAELRTAIKKLKRYGVESKRMNVNGVTQNYYRLDFAVVSALKGEVQS